MRPIVNATRRTGQIATGFKQLTNNKWFASANDHDHDFQEAQTKNKISHNSLKLAGLATASNTLKTKHFTTENRNKEQNNWKHENFKKSKPFDISKYKLGALGIVFSLYTINQSREELKNLIEKLDHVFQKAKSSNTKITREDLGEELIAALIRNNIDCIDYLLELLNQSPEENKASLQMVLNGSKRVYADFAGGGARFHIGAEYAACELEAGIKFSHVSGTSAGAMTACLISMGASPSDLRDLSQKIGLKDLEDFSENMQNLTTTLVGNDDHFNYSTESRKLKITRDLYLNLARKLEEIVNDEQTKLIEVTSPNITFSQMIDAKKKVKAAIERGDFEHLKTENPEDFQRIDSFAHCDMTVHSTNLREQPIVASTRQNEDGTLFNPNCADWEFISHVNASSQLPVIFNYIPGQADGGGGKSGNNFGQVFSSHSPRVKSDEYYMGSAFEKDNDIPLSGGIHFPLLGNLFARETILTKCVTPLEGDGHWFTLPTKVNGFEYSTLEPFESPSAEAQKEISKIIKQKQDERKSYAFK